MARRLRVPSTILALFCGSVTFVVAQTPDNQCFWKSDRTVVAEGDSWYACNNTAATPGGASVCCMKGSECGQDSICHYPTGNNGGSGWYLGGCTDGSWNDPVCPRTCTRFHNTWIQWNNTQQLWRCCGDAICTGTPTDVTFQAVAPEQWSALPSTATSTSTTSATSTVSSNNGGGDGNGASRRKKNSGGGLSTGAQAGIGVGVGIVGLAALTGLGVWLVMRRRKSHAPDRETLAPNSHSKMGPVYGAGQYQAEASAAPAYSPSTRENKQSMQMHQQEHNELPQHLSSPQELGSERPAAELPADDPRL